MKPSNLILIFLIVALTGGAGLIYLKAQTPDLELISHDVNKQLLKIDNLNSNINELALKNRFNLDANYDQLALTTTSLDRTLKDLETNYFMDLLIQGTLLEKHFINFRQLLETKKGLIENFKTHNSVLRNSEIYAPIAGRKLITITKKNGLIEAAELYRETILSVLEYAKFDAEDNINTINILLSKLKPFENQIPEEYLSNIIEFNNHVATMLVEKEKTDGYLRKALSTGSKVDNLMEAWDAWVIEKNKEKESLNLMTFIYVIFLLVFTSFIALRLRSMYVTLDREIILSTEESKKTYEELVKSEKQLMQSEKMASLGKAISGVAHEVTIPLELLTNNINIINSKIHDFDAFFDTSETLYNLVTQKPVNSGKLKETLKTHVVKYRKLRADKTVYTIDKLLKDTLFGLTQISQQVDLLEKYDQLDSEEMVTTNLNVELDSTINICRNKIGKRKLVKLYSSYLPKIKCRTKQISHVMMNVLINAVQYTDEIDGVITVETLNKNNNIYIIIKDNGQGMDEEVCRHVFDPFFTFKNTNESRGLGMSIAYKIVENHGGKILVESTPNVGTQITIQLPNNRTNIDSEEEASNINR